jgi:putative addiction module killer protein
VFKFVQSSDFDAWLDDLSDRQGKARVLVRLRRAELGNLGDYKAVGSGVLEMRVHCRGGYRVYFIGNGETIHLLTGGDKDSQTRDIGRAKALAKALRE